MSDEEILKLSYKRPSYFGQLFDRHNKRFLAAAKRTLRSADDAEDVVQETFVRIYKYGKKFSLGDGGQFRPWANAILKNCMADQINKYKKNATATLTDEMEETLNLSDEFQETPALDAEEIVPGGQGRSYVQFVLNKLDDTAAEIINLRYILGKSFKEIAKILNIKNSTARVRAYRSKKMFLEAYEEYNNKYEK